MNYTEASNIVIEELESIKNKIESEYGRGSESILVLVSLSMVLGFLRSIPEIVEHGY